MAIRSVMSICSGIAGLDQGIHLATGAKTVCYVEREAYSAATLVARMEDQTLEPAPIWDDLTTFDGKPWSGKVDCVIAGFPCQPWSVAGKKQGTADSRWLWDDIWRIVCEVRPRYVFLENVPGLLRGGIEHVLRSMAEGGYSAEWGCFSAEEVGFAHKRERLFILGKLADTVSQRLGRRGEGLEQSEEQGRACAEDQVEGSERELAESTSQRCKICRQAESTLISKTGKRGTATDAERSERELAESSSIGCWNGGDNRQGGPIQENIGIATQNQPEREGWEFGPGEIGFIPVTFAADCPECECCGEPYCEKHARHFSECECIGPTEDGYEYFEQNGKLWAKALPDTEQPGRERACPATPEGREESGDRSAPELHRTYFLPSYNASTEWRELLKTEPSLEPAVCRAVDGSADWMVDANTYREDRLRALGNGVVPLTAGLAFSILHERLNNGD